MAPALLGRCSILHSCQPWFMQPRSSHQGSGVPQHTIARDLTFILTLYVRSVPECRPSKASPGTGMPVPSLVPYIKRDGAVTEQGPQCGTPSLPLHSRTPQGGTSSVGQRLCE